MSNIGNMLNKLQNMKIKLKEIETSLESAEFSSSVGGNVVEATVNGKGKVKKLFIDNSLFNNNDSDELSELIILAVNSAISNAEINKEKKIKDLTGGLPLPPGLNLPF